MQSCTIWWMAWSSSSTRLIFRLSDHIPAFKLKILVPDYESEISNDQKVQITTMKAALALLVVLVVVASAEPARRYGGFKRNTEFRNGPRGSVITEPMPHEYIKVPCVIVSDNLA